MRTNIDLDDKLLKEAMAISGLNTKKSVIDKALREYVRSNNKKKILNFRGKKIWEGNLDDIRSTR